MKTYFILLLSLLATTISAQTTSVTIRGKVFDSSDNSPLTGATIVINGSAKYAVSADINGNFSLKCPAKTLNISISFIGYKPFDKTVANTGKTVDMGSVMLTPDAQNISEVVVQADAPMSTQKGDTLQMNASSFKANPDASSEDLLQKMPGVTVTDGTVEVQGEQVRKVYVDGKRYFEDDPALALKNLPADAVESVQFFDDQTDQAKFSGFKDGEELKAINIVTKYKSKSSTFGRFTGGYGFQTQSDALSNSDRYAIAGAANVFNDKHRWTFVLQSNNVNNQGFSLNDITGYSGRGGGRRGGDASQYKTTSSGGINNTTAAGINYSGEWGKAVKASGSYFFSDINNELLNASDKVYFINNRTLNEVNTANSKNYSHRFNFRVEADANPTNRIIWNPRFDLQSSHGASDLLSNSTLDGVANSRSANNNSTWLKGYNFSNDLSWMHRFGKAGRTLSLSTYFSASGNDGDKLQLSYYETAGDIEGQWIVDSLRQSSHLYSDGYYGSASLNYTEPLTESSQLQFLYRTSYDWSKSDNKSLDYDPATGLYTEINPNLSNYFKNNSLAQEGGLGYVYNKEAIQLNASVNYQYSTLESEELFPTTYNSKYYFGNVIPRIRFRYKPSKTKTLTVDYNGRTSNPSVSQLQNVADVSNPLQVTIGNPNLQQSYSHNLWMRYQASNVEKSTVFMLGMWATATQDYVANHTIFTTQDTIIGNNVLVPADAQIRVPTNLSGYYNMRIFATYGFPIKSLKSNLNVSGTYGFSRTPSILNYEQYYTNNNSFGLHLNLTSNVSENLDFTVSSRTSYSMTNSTQGRRTTYLTESASLFFNWIFWKGFFVNANGTYRYYRGTSDDLNQSLVLLNAAVGKKFFKKRQGELKISLNDALDQNQSIRQQNYDSYIQTSTTNVLKRYLMFSFNYKFDTRKNGTAGTAPTRMGGPGDFRGGHH